MYKSAPVFAESSTMGVTTTRYMIDLYLCFPAAPTICLARSLSSGTINTYIDRNKTLKENWSVISGVDGVDRFRIMIVSV